MLHLEREVFQYRYLSEGGCSYVLTMEDDKQFQVTIVRVVPTTQLLYTIEPLNRGHPGP